MLIHGLLLLSLVVSLEAPGASPEPARPSPAKVSLPAEGVKVPMRHWGPRPVVEATINGQGPYRLHLDTGTSVALVLDASIARKLGLPGAESETTPASCNLARPSELSSLSIGAAEFQSVEFVSMDLGGMCSTGEDGVVGILGLPLFADCLLTLDYPGQRVRFETGELPAGGAGVMGYSPDGDRDYGVTLVLSAGGVDVKAHLDTGSPSFVTLLNKLIDKLPLEGEPRVVGQARTPGGTSEVRAARLDGVLKLGTFEFERPMIDFADLGPMLDYDAGNIGSRLLRDFAVSIDQRNRRLRLTRAAPAADQAEAGPANSGSR